jgi:integrase-like protein
VPLLDHGDELHRARLESFNGTVRDEHLDLEQFSCLAEARVVIGDWGEDYSNPRRTPRWA